MSTSLYALTHGSLGLELAYALVLAPMLVSLALKGAPLCQGSCRLLLS